MDQPGAVDTQDGIGRTSDNCGQFVRLTARAAQFLFIDLPFARVEDRVVEPARGAVSIISSNAAQKHRQWRAAANFKSARDLADMALKTHHRRDVGLVEQPARHCEKLRKPIRSAVGGRFNPEPSSERAVDIKNTTIGIGGDDATGRVFHEFSQCLGPIWHVSVGQEIHPKKSRIAAETSSGTVMCGQWPVARNTFSCDPGM